MFALQAKISVSITFSSFAAENLGCNYNVMTEKIVNLLRDVIQADSQVNEMKEMVIEKIQDLFKENDPSRFKNSAKKIVIRKGE